MQPLKIVVAVVAVVEVKNMQTKKTQTTEDFVCTLEEARAFQCEAVIERFVRRFNVTDEQARCFFDDVKQWLWLAGVMSVERKAHVIGVSEGLKIDPQILIIDKMWHNFICFTKIYQNYCETHFGKMIHHYPTTEKDKVEILAKLKIDSEHQRNRKRIQYSYIYDKLGEETFKRWYYKYPEIYTEAEILRLRKM